MKSIAIERRLHRIILLLDTSGSMQTSTDAAIDSAERILSQIPPAAEVGLAFFANELVPVTRPTTDHVKLSAQLEALRKDRSSYRGKTALWVAIRESIKMFGTAQFGDVIYLISDGGENASRTRVRDIESILGNAGVRLFTLIIQNEGPALAHPDEESGLILVDEFVKETGGTTLIAKPSGFPFSQLRAPIPLVDNQGKPTQLRINLDRQLRYLLDLYRVEIYLPEPVDKPRDWKLDLVGLSKSQRDNLVLTYPTMLFPCR